MVSLIQTQINGTIYVFGLSDPEQLRLVNDECPH